MLILALDSWVGAATRPNPMKLGPGFSVASRNLRLGSRDLRPWNSPLTVHTLASAANQQSSLYRMGASTVSDTAYWLSWDTDVDVVRSMLALDTAERIYYTGDGEPRTTDNTIALASVPYPSAWRRLGVPAPDAPAGTTITTAGTATDTHTRAYVLTYVNDREEESAPSTPVTVSCKTDAVVRIDGVPGGPLGTYFVTKVRLYVSTGNDFQFVAEMAVGPTTISDNGVTRTYVLASGGATDRPAWLVPPTDLRGLIALWGGMMGGFLGKSARMCVPYKPHAWPIEYEILLHHDIVATAKWLTNWVLLTNGPPSIVTGVSPESMTSPEPIDLLEPCVSKRSAIGVGHGVCWASNRGLCYVGSNGAPRVLTEDIIEPKVWQATYNPSTIRAVRVERWYVGSYQAAVGRKAFMYDPAGGGGIIDLDDYMLGWYHDPLSDRVYGLSRNNEVQKWDAGGPRPVIDRSRQVRLPREACAAYVKVVADSYPVTVQVIATSNVGIYTETREVIDGEPHALAGGYLADRFQVEVTSLNPVQAVMLAETVKDFP